MRIRREELLQIIYFSMLIAFSPVSIDNIGAQKSSIIRRRPLMLACARVLTPFFRRLYCRDKTSLKFYFEGQCKKKNLFYRVLRASDDDAIIEQVPIYA